ncbi:MAG: sodium-dependent transporter [Gammaproteobacteria bacterium]|nr:sodium-dependent transporter [Gammaproteobacteria bacterium]MDH3806247.1 sodium-dependent transporter [Gammaproteobacteria bacterium]
MTTSGGMQWSSRLTFIMASVGCAVGLGNIWMFPYIVGSNGGGAFVLVYLIAVASLALPMLMAELMVGRRGAAGPPAAISAVARESGHSGNWRWMGILLGGVGAIMALAFYGVVGGWTLAYAYKMAAGQLQNVDAATATLIFDQLNGEAGSLLPWVTAFFATTVVISARGLQAGIEKAVKIMMPALFVMLVAMMIYAAVVGDFARAVSFLFQPDFSKLTSKTVLAAFGQAFFSVSVGITNMMAYGAYMDKKTKLPGSAAIVAGADTAVALLAGLAIFPIIFIYGLEPSGGPGLVYMALPFAFGQIPGGLVFGTVFFVLLFFAALTSSIGMLEPPVSWLRDATNLSRRSAALLAGSVAFVLCTLAALSFNELAGIYPLGTFALFENKGFFDLFIYAVTQFLMPIGGVVIAVFVGWFVKKQFSRDELFNGEDTLQYKMWLIIVRFVAPVLLALVLVDVATG